MNAIITLKEYLEKGKTFVIPSYQRGYVWGKKRPGEKDSVSNFIDDLLSRYTEKAELFLQGFTVTEMGSEIILIDGQQRTTCLYLLLKWLGYDKKFDIKYDIRDESNAFLKELDLEKIQETQEDFQDIYFFKETLRIINIKLANIDKEDFTNYILDKIRFLFINIDERQAIKVFSMMNGSRAKMLKEEIIKAELLRLASLNTSENFNISMEWENSMLRNRYAREWDKWLHWWNCADVQILFDCYNPMGLLITTYLQYKGGKELTFESFKNIVFPKERSDEAKNCFDELRRLQKRFEDAFNDPITHNKIGGILSIFNADNKIKFIKYYFANDNRNELHKYYLLTFLGMTHDEIIGLKKISTTEEKQNPFVTKFEDTLKAISDDFAYAQENKEYVFRLLLRFNIDQDNLQNRYFDFKIWKNRSLEHIFSKSTVGHCKEGKWYDGNENEKDRNKIALDRDDIKLKDGSNKTTEHSIGNLVLLYKNENSQFNSNDFNQKKKLFFSPKEKSLFKSRHLLHTICVFAEKEKWNGESIAQNRLNTIEVFKTDYQEISNQYEYKYEK